MSSAHRRESPAWEAQDWISIGTAAVLCGSGLPEAPGRRREAWPFPPSSAFTRAKPLRDAQKSE